MTPDCWPQPLALSPILDPPPAGFRAVLLTVRAGGDEFICISPVGPSDALARDLASGVGAAPWEGPA